MDEELFSSWDTEEGDKREASQREYAENRGPRFVYKPPEMAEPPAVETIEVEFSNWTFLTKNFLDQMGIPYESHELEEGPFGFGIRIKNDEN